MERETRDETSGGGGVFAVSWLLGPRAYVWSFRDDPIARSLRSARPRLHFPAYSWYWPFWPFSPTAIHGGTGGPAYVYGR